MNVHIIGGWPEDMPAAAPGQVVYRWWRRPATLARLARRILAGQRVFRVYYVSSGAFEVL